MTKTVEAIRAAAIGGFPMWKYQIRNGDKVTHIGPKGYRTSKDAISAGKRAIKRGTGGKD